MQPTPLRDLPTGVVRDLIGKVVTVKVYENAEAAEPTAVVSGTLSTLSTTTTAVAFTFIGVPEVNHLPNDMPVTIEW